MQKLFVIIKFWAETTISLLISTSDSSFLLHKLLLADVLDRESSAAPSSPPHVHRCQGQSSRCTSLHGIHGSGGCKTWPSIIILLTLLLGTSIISLMDVLSIWIIASEVQVHWRQSTLTTFSNPILACYLIVQSSPLLTDFWIKLVHLLLVDYGTSSKTYIHKFIDLIWLNNW